jgi:hypothetical protein
MGTINDKRAPWETYSASLEEKIDPKLQAEIDEYATKRHEKSSEQNEEELARWKEENDYLSKQYQFLSPEEYADEDARKGELRHSSDLIKIFREELKLKCWYRDHPHKDKITLVVKREGQEPEVGCWVQLGWMPEYSVVRFDDHGVPLNEKYRGWRTVLLQLILKGIVSEEAAHAVFGKATGPASERYNATLFSVRNNYAKVV